MMTIQVVSGPEAIAELEAATAMKLSVLVHPAYSRFAVDLAIADDSLYEIGIMPPTLKIARVRKSPNPMPSYQSEHAAGIDLMADLGGAIEMAPRERRAVPTGISVEIPVGYEGQVRPRSGRAIKDGLTLVNSPGTIDADYRGEIKVLLVNLGEQPIMINPGDRIAQLIIAPVVRAEIVEVEELAPTTRGPGGFGHTGR